ncbi:TBC domain-containing protein kinase-like protein [Frankliniella fusca]|uniref:TBC domain-containing protein kinase-like protein n=1 Tax=Frankliniella fusca TaxID=407009 RepID=A0AAE1GQV9_9NEOP|nr:TBC domain-containing protein kinase-like protein [Frankliniella fusca]
MEPRFAGMTFFATSHAGDVCGTNGLPLTPNSITIYGRSQILRTFSHPNLCMYLDIIRGKHERTMIVSEFYAQSLASVQDSISVPGIVKICHQTLKALSFINSFEIVHRCLAPDNILFDAQGNVKLFNYGLYFMTGKGADVSFPIGNPRYMAPEVFLVDSQIASSPKVDIWSLGIILAEQALGLGQVWSELKLAQLMRKVLSLINCNSDTSVFSRIAREHSCWTKYENLPQSLVHLINSCLQLNPSDRPTPKELLQFSIFKEYTLDDIQIGKFDRPDTLFENIHPLNSLPLQELYYLWRLAGGDVQSELKKQGLIRTMPPILSVPRLVLLEGSVLGKRRDQTSLLDLKIIPLSLDSLRNRLAPVPFSAYYPLIETKSDILNEEEECDAATLPLIIRERDTEYQFRRVVLFRRLLEGYPHTKASIVREARQDIPPLYRGRVWAALLEVEGDFESFYVETDKETPNHTDRQIEVDIPRCHQYDELLSSREGHRKFKRVLKAWVERNPQYVYWQGLDSLCAPFIYLNFNNEALAFACLSAFIPKYLHRFFLKDNSAVIREYLAKFTHIIAFHDPELSNHLQEIGFIPELFAIPWFLTMFSQVDIERCLSDSVAFYCCTPRSTTYRQHERCPGKISQKNKPYHPDLEMSAQSVAELQAESCPRISGADLLDLLDSSKFPRPKVLVVDVRNPELFHLGTAPGSINIPHSRFDLTQESPPLPACPEANILLQNRGKILVVAGQGDSPHAVQVAQVLLRNGLPKVCVLNRGIDVLQLANLLTKPTSS